MISRNQHREPVLCAEQEGKDLLPDGHVPARDDSVCLRTLRNIDLQFLFHGFSYLSGTPAIDSHGKAKNLAVFEERK